MNRKNVTENKAAAVHPAKNENDSQENVGKDVHNVRISNYLRTGKENKMPASELMELLGAKDRRQLRTIIHRARDAGEVIASTSKDGGGYYIPKDQSELAEYISIMEGHALSELKVLKTARAAMKCGGVNGEL